MIQHLEGPAIAVVNAGSSSIKMSLYTVHATDEQHEGGLDLVLRTLTEGLATAPRFIAHDAAGNEIGRREWGQGHALSHADATDHLIAFVGSECPGLHLLGIGHRVVHGGTKFEGPVRVTPAVLAELEALSPLAPLHQPHNLAPIRLGFERAPDVPQVACFDTAFHRSNSELVQMYALPQALHDAGVRRYGFHGLSYEYIASVLPRIAPGVAQGRVVVLHLGNGASACALQGGRSVASSMGFTALDGLPMGTRCGAIDPGVLLYLMQERGMDAKAIEHLLYQESGLLGVSGVSSDMRALEASDSPRAALAIELFAYRIQREVGSLVAALGGLDALVFTAGIGENAAAVRARVVRGLAWTGMALDEAANAAGGPCISPADGRCTAWVIPTDEEAMIARQVRMLLGTGHASQEAAR